MPTPKTKKKHRLIQILIDKQGTNCCYCEVGMIRVQHQNGKNPPKNAITLEHLKRLEDGGTFDLDNLALACFDCNSGRGKIDWFAYKTYKMGELFG